MADDPMDLQRVERPPNQHPQQQQSRDMQLWLQENVVPLVLKKRAVVGSLRTGGDLSAMMDRLCKDKRQEVHVMLVTREHKQTLEILRAAPSDWAVSAMNYRRLEWSRNNGNTAIVVSFVQWVTNNNLRGGDADYIYLWTTESLANGIWDGMFRIKPKWEDRGKHERLLQPCTADNDMVTFQKEQLGYKATTTPTLP